MKFRPAVILFTLGASVALNAAPKLRLTQTAVGPFVIAQGSNGPATIQRPPCAYNAGDGALNLKLTSSDTWLVPTLGPSTFCESGAGSSQIVLGLQTSSLAKGSYTGTITATDPNALDSPQTITVTVDIGGNVPDQLTFYAPPGGFTSTTFYTATNALARASTQSGGPWLSVAAGNVGSFQFTTSYNVAVNATNLAAGDYSGNIGVSNSQLAADNKTVAVTLHVTTQPIVPPQTGLQFEIAQGASKQSPFVQLINGGQGTLTLSGATATTASGGNWLTAKADTTYSLVTITADPAGLSPGVYQGTVMATSNAVNSPTAIPVQLTVLAPGPPLVKYKRAVTVFTYSPDDGLAQGSVAVVFGNQFTTGDPQVSNLPLSTTFAGVQVLINGQPVPVQYVSAGQINIQIPYDAPTGDVTLAVVRNGTQGNQVSIHIDPIKPVVLPFPGTNYALAQTATGGFEGYSPGTPAHVGDVVVLYAVGLGATSPAVTAGTAAPLNPLATVPGVKICFGDISPIDPFGRCFDPQFAGLTPTFFGLYQINFQVPNVTGDAVPMFVQVGQTRSNILNLAIQ
jgi:uncharacterized protein (TIGR03437 family)